MKVEHCDGTNPRLLTWDEMVANEGIYEPEGFGRERIVVLGYGGGTVVVRLLNGELTPYGPITICKFRRLAAKLCVEIRMQ